MLAAFGGKHWQNDFLTHSSHKISERRARAFVRCVDLAAILAFFLRRVVLAAALIAAFFFCSNLMSLLVDLWAMSVLDFS